MFTQSNKDEKVALAKAHAAADRLASGFFTHDKDNRGCSVGCDAYDIRRKKQDDWDLDDGPSGGYHAYVANYFGTPAWIEHLRDSVFEGLREADRADWHVDLAEALPVGGDFEKIRHLILRDILLEIADKSIGEGDEDWHVECRAAVQSVAALHAKALEKQVPKEDWDAAGNAARAAVRVAWDATCDAAGVAVGAAGDADAAGNATLAAVRAAVRAAGDAACDAAGVAVGAAVAASWAPAEVAAYRKIAEITLKHLREARYV